MTCRRLTQPLEHIGTLHWMTCGECRDAAEADEKIRLALECMRAEAQPSAGPTLAALGLGAGRGSRTGLARVLEALGLDAVDALSRWRARLRRLAVQAVGAVVGLCVLLVGWVLWADRDPSYRVETPALVSPNAFSYFREAGKSLDSSRLIYVSARTSPAVRAADRSLYTTMVPRVTSDRAPMSATERPAISDRALITRNAEALRLLRAGFSYAYREPPIRSVDAPADHFSAYRALAMLLAVEGRARASAGNLSGAVDSDLGAIQLGASCQNGGPKISKLVGLQCEAIGRAGLWDRLGHLSARDAARAAREVLNRAASKPDSVSMLEEERRACIAAFTRLTATHRWRWDGVSGVQRSATASDRLLWFVFTLRTTRSAAVERYSRLIDGAIADCRDPYARGAAEVVWSQWDPTWALIGWPEYQHVVLRDRIDTAENHLLASSLALRAYRLTKGSLPKSLYDLVKAGLLPQVPHDPFDPMGRALRYAVVLGRPVIYSVGPDGRDDGGVPILNSGEAATDSAVQRAVWSDSIGDIVAGVNQCW